MEINVKAGEIQSGAVSSKQLGSETVAIANVDGTFYAFSDVCTHRGCSLAEGRIDGQEVVCGCHGSRFNVETGEVVGGPAREALKTYRTQVDGDNVTVSD